MIFIDTRHWDYRYLLHTISQGITKGNLSTATCFCSVAFVLQDHVMKDMLFGITDKNNKKSSNVQS